MYRSFESFAKDLVSQYKARVAEKILTTEFNCILDKFRECFKISDMEALISNCLGKVSTVSVEGNFVGNPKDIQLRILSYLISSQLPMDHFWRLICSIGLDDYGNFTLRIKSKDSVLHTLSSTYVFEHIEEIAKFTDPDNELYNNLVRFKHGLER